MTALSGALADYLALRRALGFRLERAGKLLGQFAGFLEAQDAGVITIARAVAWARLPEKASPRWLAMRMSAVRGFAAYLHAIDPRHEVPPAGLFPDPGGRPVPYLYSGADITALMTAAGNLNGEQRRAAYRALVGLLAVSGIRIGEAIRLDDGDLDEDSGTLLVRQSKSGRPRIVPLHPTTIAEIRAYQRVRDRTRPLRRTDALFTTLTGARLNYPGTCTTFRRLVTLAGLPARPGARPTIHGLRHSMAVTTLLEWCRDGEDVRARIPQLSAMLGHSGPRDTYYYLHAAPELLALAGQRLEHYLEEPS
ncbi:MAG TPA: integrase [Actinobacteria bacterium]|nr:integrase [Actinomycetota bacterium]